MTLHYHSKVLVRNNCLNASKRSVVGRLTVRDQTCFTPI